MIIEVFHVLDEDAAFQKVRKGVEDLVKSNSKHIHGYNSSWESRSGKITCIVRGCKVFAKLRVTANKVVIESNLPWAFLLFKKQIVETVKDKVQKALI